MSLRSSLPGSWCQCGCWGCLPGTSLSSAWLPWVHRALDSWSHLTLLPVSLEVTLPPSLQRTRRGMDPTGCSSPVTQAGSLPVNRKLEREVALLTSHGIQPFPHRKPGGWEAGRCPQ